MKTRVSIYLHYPNLNPSCSLSSTNYTVCPLRQNHRVLRPASSALMSYEGSTVATITDANYDKEPGHSVLSRVSRQITFFYRENVHPKPNTLCFTFLNPVSLDDTDDLGMRTLDYSMEQRTRGVLPIPKTAQPLANHHNQRDRRRKGQKINQSINQHRSLKK